jgi:tetratricopeptide (TPR) repeat protein
MATSSHRRLSRKELRQPDEFVSFVDAAGDFIAQNLGKVILGAIAILALVLFIVGLRFYVDQRNRLVAEAFYQAVNDLDHKDYVVAAGKFMSIARDYPRTSLGRLASFYLANDYMAQKQPLKARDELQRYLGDDNQAPFHELALMQLGVANEDLGNYADARKAYEQAASLKGPERGRAEMNAARLMVREGDRAGAIAAYQGFIRENPFSPESASATEALARLGVAPLRFGSSGNAVELPSR